MVLATADTRPHHAGCAPQRSGRAPQDREGRRHHLRHRWPPVRASLPLGGSGAASVPQPPGCWSACVPAPLGGGAASVPPLPMLVPVLLLPAGWFRGRGRLLPATPCSWYDCSSVGAIREGWHPDTVSGIGGPARGHFLHLRCTPPAPPAVAGVVASLEPSVGGVLLHARDPGEKRGRVGRGGWRRPLGGAGTDLIGGASATRSTAPPSPSSVHPSGTVGCRRGRRRRLPTVRARASASAGGCGIRRVVVGVQSTTPRCWATPVSALLFRFRGRHGHPRLPSVVGGWCGVLPLGGTLTARPATRPPPSTAQAAGEVCFCHCRGRARQHRARAVARRMGLAEVARQAVVFLLSNLGGLLAAAPAVESAVGARRRCVAPPAAREGCCTSSCCRRRGGVDTHATVTGFVREMTSRGFGIMIRIQHRSVSSGILLAATSYVTQSFHEEPEHQVNFPAVSSVLLSHWLARRFQRIYPDISGYIPDSAEKPGF